MPDKVSNQHRQGQMPSGRMGYGRFAAMIATSTIVMFGLMYLNTYLLTHVFWSETRVYMAILMGASMAIIMLGYMLSMYPSKRVNSAIFLVAAATFAAMLWLVRSQATVDDESYMRAMIPHHSIAIMTSSRAGISDPRVRKLADEIIYAQDKEIAEMRYLVSDIEANGDGDEGHGAAARIVTLQEALGTAHIPVLDPEFMTSDEVETLFGQGAVCTFTYTTHSPPVLGIGHDGTAVLKLSGDLIRLEVQPDANAANGRTLAAEGITLQLSAPEGEAALSDTGKQQYTDMILSLDAGLRAGYRGFLNCDV
jgi:hypothetical protein